VEEGGRANPERSGSSPANDSEQLLTFIVDGEEYGVDILRVQEIRSWSTPMPMREAAKIGTRERALREKLQQERVVGEVELF
jgi:hypothetical protein